MVTAQAILHIVRLIVLSRGGISRREFLTGLIVIVGAIAIAAGVWLTVAGQGFAATLIGALGWIVAEIGGGIDTFAQRNQPRRGFDRQDRAPPAFWELCLAGLRGAAIIIAMLFALATAIMDAAWLTAPVDFFAIIAKGILVQFGNMVSLVIASIGLVFGVILAIANLIVKLRKPQQAGAVPMGPIVGGGGAGGDDDDDAGPVPRVRQRRRREAYQKHLVKVSEAKREARRGRIWRAPE